MKKINSIKIFEGRSRVAISFSGELVKKDLTDLNKNRHVCLLVLDQVEDPQNLAKIIRQQNVLVLMV